MIPFEYLPRKVLWLFLGIGLFEIALAIIVALCRFRA